MQVHFKWECKPSCLLERTRCHIVWLLPTSPAQPQPSWGGRPWLGRGAAQAVLSSQELQTTGGRGKES